jgi:hypothetical protein
LNGALATAPFSGTTRIAAAIGVAAPLQLLLEARYGFRVRPARTCQVVVVLIPIFPQTPQHMAVGLMSSECTATHFGPFHEKRTATRSFVISDP